MASVSSDRPAHIVGFYTTEDFVIGQIAAFVAEGLQLGDQVLVLATAEHWTAVTAELEARGMAPGHATARGRLVIMDADGVLDQIVQGGDLDIERFRGMLTTLLSGPGSKRMYGEVVGSLTARGDVDGAARIEAVVHEVSHSLGVPILCGYNLLSSKPLTPGDVVRLQQLHDGSFSEPDARPAARRSGHFHAVRFFRDGAELSELVAEFVGEGLQRQEPSFVFATVEHRDQIAAELGSRGFDVQRLIAEKRLMLLDATGALAEFMVDGMPDASRFRASVGAVLADALDGRAQGTVRAYGEMVDILWRRGETVAATRLEMLWNELAKTHDFSLLCGYSMGQFYKNADVRIICEQHSHLMSASGDTAAVQ